MRFGDFDARAVAVALMHCDVESKKFEPLRHRRDPGLPRRQFEAYCLVQVISQRYFLGVGLFLRARHK